MKKAFLFFTMAACMAFAQPAIAQRSGDVALGIRLSPDGGGFSGKFFVHNNFAIEALLNASGYNGTALTAVGLLEYHIIFPDPSWRMFMGGGIHLGAWNEDRDEGNHGVFGIDGIIGVEYRFKHIPLGLSADFKPALNLGSVVEYYPANDVGLAARFYFGNLMPREKHHD